VARGGSSDRIVIESQMTIGGEATAAEITAAWCATCIRDFEEAIAP
jgi:hypothetical protein